MIELKKADIPSPDYCVYRLLDDEKRVIYVGQTSGLERRIWQHVGNGKEFTFFEFIECAKGDATGIEADEIIKHNPELNTVLPKTDKYLHLGQAKKLIHKTINQVVNKEKESLTDSLEIVFHRPKNKNMYFTYVSASQVESIIDDISKHKFVKLD